jgi:hypothetical protein
MSKLKGQVAVVTESSQGIGAGIAKALTELALRNWKAQVDRADKFFGGLAEDDLLQEVAPGKNRLIYLLGHLTATHDALIPLLGFGERRHPELDLLFLPNPDRAVETTVSGKELKRLWTETNEILWQEFSKLAAADWLERHSAVTQEDFVREPYRNRFNILLGRTAHIAYHLGQAILARRTA